MCLLKKKYRHRDEKKTIAVYILYINSIYYIICTNSNPYMLLTNGCGMLLKCVSIKKTFFTILYLDAIIQ